MEFTGTPPRVVDTNTNENNGIPPATPPNPNWIRIQNFCNNIWIEIQRSPRLTALLTASIICIGLGDYRPVIIVVIVIAAVFFDRRQLKKDYNRKLNLESALQKLQKIKSEFESEHFTDKINESKNIEELIKNIEYVIQKIDQINNSISLCSKLPHYHVFDVKKHIKICLNTVKTNQNDLSSASDLFKAHKKDVIGYINLIPKVLVDAVKELSLDIEKLKK